GPAQPAGRGAAGQLRRAFGRRAAAALLPHHRRGARGPARLGRRLARDPRLRRRRPGGDMSMNSQKLPTTIPEYLEQLRRSLAGADPALVQDALYDAEEYLRSELAEQAGKTEAEVIAAVASSYGAPDEVAEIYRDTEVTVQTALRAPSPRSRSSALGRFSGVFADPRAHASLFYLVLSLAPGLFYFTGVVARLPPRRGRGRAAPPWAGSSACSPTRAPTPRCSTWCCRWPPGSSTSPGWWPASPPRWACRSPSSAFRC